MSPVFGRGLRQSACSISLLPESSRFGNLPDSWLRRTDTARKLRGRIRLGLNITMAPCSPA
jgi:hypothetical protein